MLQYMVRARNVNQPDLGVEHLQIILPRENKCINRILFQLIAERANVMNMTLEASVVEILIE
jgi:hypothetical protein